MSETIFIPHDKLHVDFRITDDREFLLTDFSTGKALKNYPDKVLKQYLPFEILCTGEGCVGGHGYKHHSGKTGTELRYEEREEYQNYWGKKLEVTLSAPNGLEAVYHIQFFNEIGIARSWMVVTNRGSEEIGLEYVSSFNYKGLCQNGEKPFYDRAEVYIPHNTWYSEVQWQKYPMEQFVNQMLDDGFRSPRQGHGRLSYGVCGSWSSADYLPMGMLHDNELNETYIWQIESSCGWHAEYSAIYSGFCLSLSGPNEDEGHWWKNLHPGESFTTVTAAFGVVEGGVSEAVAELTQYRRIIRRPNEDDEKLNLVFNDYMNCLFGDPTEEKEIPIIDKAAELGCEYYCIDAGWYDDGPWWYTVGEWKEAPSRFPNGLKKITDYIIQKGMKPGLWVEIEVIGVSCPIADQLPDDWFILRHGKRHVDRGRYHLDFRNPAVREYATKTLERLMDDYGVYFFKVDYNITTGIGTDFHADSYGDGLLEHTRALYGWYSELYKKYPNLIIESCSSGGQRMDYGILQGHSLQSITDQTDYIYNAYITAAAATAVTPEQAGIWTYPYEDDKEHVIFNMVNGLLLRPYISGQVWGLSEANLALMKEGIDLYKEIRSDVRQGVPYFPLGLPKLHDPTLAYGNKVKDTLYLSVFGITTDTVTVPLNPNWEISSVQVIYPNTVDCTVSQKGNELTVTLPQSKSARLLKLKITERA